MITVKTTQGSTSQGRRPDAARPSPMGATRALHAIAHFLQQPLGFIATQAFWVAWLVVGMLTHWSSEWLLVFTLVLSILAIAMSSVILVAGHYSEQAIHKKLDALLIHLSEAPSEMAGIEKIE